MPSAMDQVVRQLRALASANVQESLSDGQLLEAFLASRDEPAFEALVLRHGGMVMGVCRRILGNLHDAEDAFQATFLVLVRKADSIRPREMVGNWLHGVACHTAMKAKLYSARRQTRENKSAQEQASEAPETPDNGWLHLLDQELNGLPTQYRVPIVLCDLEGKTRKEAARVMGCPEGTISGRLARARQMLAKRLKRQGVAVPAGALALAVWHTPVSASTLAPLARSTARSAMLYAAGQSAAAQAAPIQVVKLADGVLKSMLLTKLKVVVCLVIALAFVGSGTAWLASASSAREIPDSRTPPAVKPADSAKPANDPRMPDNKGNDGQKKPDNKNHNPTGSPRLTM